MPFGVEVDINPGDFVLDAPPPEKGYTLQFSAHICCGQTAGCIKMPLGTEVGLSPGDFVLDGDPARLPKKGAEPPPQFSAHLYCDQTAGCIAMPLGTEVGLGLRDIVLDCDHAATVATVAHLSYC